MKKMMMLLWLIFPVGLIYFHYEKGPAYQFDKKMAEESRIAKDFKNKKEWEKSYHSYEKMVSEIKSFSFMMEQGASKKKKNKLRKRKDDKFSNLDILNMHVKLAQANVMVNMSELAEAIEQIESILIDLNRLKIDNEFTADVRSSLAVYEYYAAWHMRLEGHKRSEWMKEAEVSRQLFKLLAEKAHRNGNEKKAEIFQKNLECTIRLEQMDLPTLIGLALPKEGGGLGSKGVGKKRGQAKKKGPKSSGDGAEEEDGKGDGKKPTDSRKAGFGDFKPDPGS